MQSLSWRVLICVLVVAGLAGGKKTNKVKRGSVRQAVTCGDGNFLCSNGQCIQDEWLCDTEDDCGNNEDEVGCPTDCSGENQVKCANNRCEPLEYRCDGDNDCGDGTDEQGCATWACTTYETKCPNGICIEKSSLCDGVRDCPDGWDETSANCSVRTGLPG